MAAKLPKLYLVFSQYFCFGTLPFSRWKFFTIQDEKFLFLGINLRNSTIFKTKSKQQLQIQIYIYTEQVVQLLTLISYIKKTCKNFFKSYKYLIASIKLHTIKEF